jgi:hypothetical protein
MGCKKFATTVIRKKEGVESVDPEFGDVAKVGTDASSAQPLSMTRTLSLGAAVALAALCMGFNYHCVTVTLNHLAESLKIAEGDLQWASNAYMLAMESSPSTCNPQL